MDSAWDSESACCRFKSQSASWLLCNILGQEVNSMCASPHQGVKLVPGSGGEWRNNVHSK